MGATWVYAEVTPDGAHPSALELLTKARGLGGEVAAVALGPGASSTAKELGEHGATTVYASDDQAFADRPGRTAAPPIAAARSSSIANGSGPPRPRPPAMTTLASSSFGPLAASA